MRRPVYRYLGTHGDSIPSCKPVDHRPSPRTDGTTKRTDYLSEEDVVHTRQAGSRSSGPRAPTLAGVGPTFYLKGIRALRDVQAVDVDLTPRTREGYGEPPREDPGSEGDRYSVPGGVRGGRSPSGVGRRNGLEGRSWNDGPGGSSEDAGFRSTVHDTPQWSSHGRPSTPEGAKAPDGVLRTHLEGGGGGD